MTATLSSLDTEARQILTGNDRGTYTVPTHGLYPYQWNWDSAIAALGFAMFDPDRAWVELETLLSGQWSDGMVPHILFHQVDPRYFPGPDVWGGVGPMPSSGITQPPIAATMARQIWGQSTPAEATAAAPRLRALYPKLLAWHRWIMQWRLDEHGAVCTTHPWETGRDNAPDWDKTLARMDASDVGAYARRDTSHVDSGDRPKSFDYDRYIKLVQIGHGLKWNQDALLSANPFRVADPTMSFTSLRAARDLLAMGHALALDTDGLGADIARLKAGALSLWNGDLGAFDARDAHTGEFAHSLSNASYMCWFAGIESEPMLARLRRVMTALPYPVPSLDAQDPRFEPRRYWRGPTWAIMNMMIGMGLAEMGHGADAQALRLKTKELIANHGFAEYFDPRNGSPAGGKLFTWTAAVWLAWAGRTTWAV